MESLLLFFFLSFGFTLAIDIITPARFIKDGEKLVSSFQRFELGFFSPGNSYNRYLGIWYKVSPEAVVWVANRNNPIIGPQGILTIGKDGNLVLLNRTQSIIWSSNVSRKVQNPVAHLLDTGDLVVSDLFRMSYQNTLWRSFDHPSDTLLPGMKLGWNSHMQLDRYLTSWRSADDPSNGNFTFKFSTEVLPQLVIYRGSTKVANKGDWNGVCMEELRMNSNYRFNQFVVRDGDGSYYSYEPVQGPIIMLLRLDESGKMQRLIWNKRWKGWDAVYSSPSDLCEIYGRCGAHGDYSLDNEPICECLEKFRQDSYIRIPASELVTEFHSIEKIRQKTILGISIIFGLFILCLLLFAIWKKTKKIVQESRNEKTEVPLFDLSTIATATNNFSEENLIGAGGFGSVYKGNLSSGVEIAVKRLSKNSRQGAEEFRNEVILIAKLQHKNLVGLLGSCIQGEERMLIYEYMKNKSLDYFIFDQKKTALLTWQKRYDIVMGIARGLLYLHQDSKLQIIHRDLKASNILLDNDLNPKISDFGLARIFRGDGEAKTKRVIGTYGYMSPEYTIDGTFSVKSDVFSFGVLLLEIVSGKKNRGFCHSSHHHNLLGHAWLLWNGSRVLELLDPCLDDSCVESQVLRCVQVGLLCVQKFAEDRPTMSSVVLMLANIAATLPEPKKPGFFTERSSSDIEAKSIKLESHTANSITMSVLQGR